jgi:hypothetical protein
MVNQWGTIGIPSENRFVGLFYEPESKQFLAQFQNSLGGEYGTKSIYARHVTDDTYRRITPETDDLSFEDILLCPRASKILVNVFSIIRKGNRHAGREWHSVQEIDTNTGEMRTVFTPDDLHVEPQYSKAWVSRLRNVKEESPVHGRLTEISEEEYVREPGTHAVYGSAGKEILCTVSFKKKKSGHDGPVEDFLCKVSPERHEYRKISRITGAAKDLASQDKPSADNLAV